MIRSATVAASLLATATLGSAAAAPHQLLLDVRFPARAIAKIEVGDFHFRPGQKAPVHTHKAPAIGYVSQGTIYYQVEGQPAQILKAGDAFYEPAGPRILHFDNASPTKPAVFTDFNLQQAGEPFIVFAEPPHEAIDRRALPAAPGARSGITGARAEAQALRRARTIAGPLLGYVAQGSVTLGGKGYRQGETFSLAEGAEGQLAPQGAAARVIAFTLTR